MVLSYEIEHITKSAKNSYQESILYIGGITNEGVEWKLSEAEVIFGIETNIWQFHVNIVGHKSKIVIEKSATGKKHLKVTLDCQEVNSLIEIEYINKN